MTPGFTAEAALAATLSAFSGRREPEADGGMIVPQQRRNPIEPLEYAGATLQCPGCYTHYCGFLGLSTCLTCC
jgi:hypothetical protein